MKTIILASGGGTRLAEETDVHPKPMVEIGHRPILWHILKIYAHYGYTDFLDALGHKGEHIKRHMADYASLSSNLTVVSARAPSRCMGTRTGAWNSSTRGTPRRVAACSDSGITSAATPS